jgi:polyisoprenoid-binding protein YceI/formylglycine-generating enzyme required for sulfatase activity
MKKALIGLGAVVILVGILYVMIPAGEDAATGMDQAGAGDARVVEALTAEESDQEVELDASNTHISFSCTKTLAGKAVAVHGGWSGDFGSRLTGTALLDPVAGTVRRLQVEIDTASLWSEHDILTDALLHKGFFHVDEHPTAVFVSTDIREGTDPSVTLEGATHTIEGNFTLNGIERSIQFPARLEVGDQALQMTSAFSLDRKAFDVNFTDTVGFGLLTDEDISHAVALKVKVDIKPAAEAVADAGDDAENEAGPVAPVDLASLPATYTETIPASQIDFDLVLVPGDETEGIRPLYVGANEVTWDEFMPWVVCEDLSDSDEHGELRARKLRPSLPYGDITRGFGSYGYPALSMSRLSAELYCKWLSEQLGKTFRLPTEAEWLHIYEAGGGNPDEPPANADAIAVYLENSEDDITMDYATRPVGSKEPNALGIHDMAGNVCEWVLSPKGVEERVARGGHFQSPIDAVGVGRHVEHADWNKNYPNEPKSIWWFVDARWVGFRVVREL